MTRLTYEFVAASGRNHRDCVALGRRYPEDYGPAAAEHFVLEIDGSVSRVVLHRFARYADVWRADSGTLFVAGGVAGLHVRAPGDAFRTHRLAGQVCGVWGLDERFVLAVGHDGLIAHGTARGGCARIRRRGRRAIHVRGWCH